MVLIPATILTVVFFSDIRAGFGELLPRDAPSLRALEELHQRLGAQSRLIVIAESNDASANRRFISELGMRIQARKIPEARFIQTGCHEECTWLRNHAPFLMTPTQFDELMGLLENTIRKSKVEANPFFVNLEDQPEQPKARSAELDRRLESEIRDADRFPNGFFETPDGHRVVMLISLQGSEVELEPSANLLAAVKQEERAIRGKYPAEMTVGYNGEVVNLVEEHDAILSDLSLSSVVVFLLVGGLIFFYFRSIRGLVAVLFGLFPGLLVTFAIGRLTVDHLNSNTAFLGSIIAGNGINYPLLFLAYYRSSPISLPRVESMWAAARNAFFGTLGAALTASAAYGGLAVSTFRGFSQFGWIGGIGMITTWFFTFITMPIAIALFDPPRQEVKQTAMQERISWFFSRKWLPRLSAMTFVALALIGFAVGVRHERKYGLYEMNLEVLRNRDSLKNGSAYWDSKVSEVFGIWLNPIAALVNDPAHRVPVADELRRVLITEPPALAERVETIDQFVPPKETQEQRIERLKKLARSLQHVPRDSIPERARPLLDAWLSPDVLKPFDRADVPWALRRTFSETEGRDDRVVLLFPSLRINFNDGKNILSFVDRLREAKLPSDAVVGGGFIFMADIIRLVRDEAPKIVIVVAMLVALVLVPFLFRRPRRILLVVTTVGTVAIVAQAVMLGLGVKVNMLNFAAVPITIGIGADYVVNLLGAMDAFKLDAKGACVRMGGAILLCSLTTIVGYVSLVLAQSGALRSFGLAAVFGEVMAVTTVLLVLPVLLPSHPRSAPAAVQD